MLNLKNHELCLTSIVIAYLNLLSSSSTGRLRFSAPPIIFNDGDNCIINTKVISCSDNIAGKRYSNSLLAAFGCLSPVISYGNLTAN